jgi:hypothetical protein
MDDLAKKLSIKSYEDWYRLHPQDIIQHGGISMFSLYKRCVSRTVMSIYPGIMKKKYV